MSEALWALGRGTGVASLVLISLALVFGLVTRSGRPIGTLPRFSVALIHRNVSLLASVFVVIHVLSLLFDSSAQLKLVDLVLPFLGSYRPVWLGLGTLGVDLLIAVIVTSLLRRRIGQRAFRFVHWFSYAMFPVALFHSIFTGTDAATPWFIAVAVFCSASVVAAAGWRLSHRFTEIPKLEAAR
jgi:sulfoxide reductase heme-binding subunit YedZ